MTAEVALLNKSAVALAADSAMTLGSTGKIYPANKLFSLSRHAPLGIMIYNATEFMEVPWETLIKGYRDALGKESRATVREYVDDFLAYIFNPEICTDEVVERNTLRIATENFDMIREAALNRLRQTVNQTRRWSTRDEGNAIRRAAEERLVILENGGESQSMERVNAARVAFTYRDELDALISRVFENLHVFCRDRRLLHRIFGVGIRSAELSRGNSGVVIAGFGEDEMFPTLAEVVTDGVVAGTLKYNLGRYNDIGRSGTYSANVPFAQSEMVQRFMEGIDPEFLDYLGYSTEELLYQFGHAILSAHGLDNDQRLENLREAAERQVQEHFGNKVASFCNDRFVESIMGVVGHLPKDELAGMAEALVNLTSVKRRVSLDQETVGGPIDIAVISKGDGFVWIKRKHYFDAAVNPGYLRR